MKERAINLGIETLQVLFSPLLVLALEVAAVYGIYRPTDGLKLQQNIQILIYDEPLGLGLGLDPDVILTPLPEAYKQSATCTPCD